jgi:cell division septation protein DedD
MRLLLILILSGLVVLGSSGCSEKQKEASRMEQEVKDLEATDDSLPSVLDSAVSGQPSTDSARTSPEGGPAPSADPTAVPPEMRPAVEAAHPAVEAARPAETPVSKPQEVAPKPAMPPAPAGAGYTVQIASCESEDYARHLVQVYTKRGYEPFVATITYNNLLYYRVRVGNFKKVAEAKVLRDELTDRFSVKAWVDRTE